MKATVREGGRDGMWKQTRKTELERDGRCGGTGIGADQQGPGLSAVFTENMTLTNKTAFTMKGSECMLSVLTNGKTWNDSISLLNMQMDGTKLRMITATQFSIRVRKHTVQFCSYSILHVSPFGRGANFELRASISSYMVLMLMCWQNLPTDKHGWTDRHTNTRQSS